MSDLSPLLNRVKDGKYDRPTKAKNDRKTRNDKKHDVRIPVNKEEKWWVRLFSGENNMSMTQYTTLLVEKGLTRSLDFPDYPYSDSEIIVHAKIDQKTYKELRHIAANWDCSIRQVTYRIFRHMLILEINEE